MEQGYWNRIKDHGNPTKQGYYDVILLYEKDGKQYASQKRRWFGPAEKNYVWLVMKGQPKEGLAWHEGYGSHEGEQVYAWYPLREFPDPPELPEDAEWEE